MSKASSKFAGMRTGMEKPVAATPIAVDPIAPAPTRVRPSAREGKKQIAGHFSAEAHRAINMLAVEEGTTVQALLGEGLDLLFRQRGKHPLGER